MSGRARSGSRPMKVPQPQRIEWTDGVVYQYIQEIGPRASGGDSERLTAICKLRLQIEASDTTLSNSVIERLWLATRDLLQPDQPPEAQMVALSFVCALLHAPRESLSDSNRTIIFGVIVGHETAEHIPLLLDALRLMTDDCTKIVYLEASIGEFLLEVFPQTLRFKCFHNLLWLINKLFRLHAHALEPPAVLDLVACVCHTCSISFEPVDIKGCLAVMDTMARSDHLTPTHLTPLLTALCRTAQVDQFNEACLALTEAMMNKDVRLGLQSVAVLCGILSDPKHQTAINLLRGAVFMLSHAGWGNMVIETIQVNPAHVLPAFFTVSEYQHDEVTYEVVLSLNSLAQKQGASLDAATWDAVIKVLQSCMQVWDETNLPMLCSVMDELLKTLERYLRGGHYTGSPERLVALLEAHPGERDMTFALEFKMKILDPSVPGWVDNAYGVVQRYFREETRPALQLKVLAIIESIWKSAPPTQQNRLIDSVILVFFADPTKPASMAVTIGTIQLLGTVLSTCDHVHFDAVCSSVFAGLEPALTALPNGAKVAQLDEVEQAAIRCLTDAFISRLSSRNTRLTQRPLRMLLYFAHRRCQTFTELAKQHAEAESSGSSKAASGSLDDDEPSSRGMDSVLLALQTLAVIRWDSYGRIFVGDNEVSRNAPSPYLRIRPDSSDDYHSGRRSNTVVADIVAHQRAAAKVFDFRSPVSALDVVKQIAEMFIVLIRHPYTPVKMLLPVVGGVRSLLNSTHFMVPRIFDMSQLSTAVCAAILRLTALLENTKAPVIPAKSSQDSKAALLASRAEAERMDRKLALNDLYSIVSVMVVYKAHLLPHDREKIVDCLKESLSVNFEPCLRALGACALELRGSVVRSLKSILNILQKFKSNHRLKLGLLEFLSIVGRLPAVSKNLVFSDFKGVFIIFLETTDRLRKSNTPYLVTLAYHVIAVWFMHISLDQRREIAPFIAKGLRQYSGAATSDPHDKLDPSVETCLEMMARYTFDDSREPTTRRIRGPSSFFAGHAERSWMYGSTMVTIVARDDGWARVTVRKCTGKVEWVTRLLTTDQPIELTLGEIIANIDVHADLRAELRDLAASVAPGYTAANTPASSTRTSTQIGSNEEATMAEVELRADSDDAERQESGHSQAQPIAVPKTALPRLDALGPDRRRQHVQSVRKRPTPKSERSSSRPLQPLSNTYDSDGSIGSGSQTGSLTTTASSLEKSSQDQLIHHSVQGLMQGESPVGRQKGMRAMVGIESHFIQQHSGERRDLWCPSVELDDSSRALTPITPLSPSPTMSAPAETENLDFELYMGLDPFAFDDEQPRPPATAKGRPLRISNLRNEEAAVAGSPSVIGFHSPSPRRAVGSSDDSGLIDRSATLKPSPQKSSEPPMLGRQRSKTLASIDTSFKRPAPKPSNLAESFVENRRWSMDRFKRPVVDRRQSTDETGKSTHPASFLFHQMHHLPYFASRPVLLKAGSTAGAGDGDVERTVRMLDRIPAYHTHKIGVVYVAPNQTDSTEILGNELGSARYVEFLSLLGNIVLLKDLSPVYSGGLDCETGKHGQYMCLWQGDISHVAFHVATLMPTLPDDAQCVNKRMHIDNRHVTIVYNDSGADFQREWLSGGAVNFAYIIVCPMGNDLFRVSVDIREGMDSVLSIMDDRVASTDTVGVFCRQLAIHANMASLAHRKQKGNWEERLKVLKTISAKHGVEPPADGDPTIDFTHFL